MAVGDRGASFRHLGVLFHEGTLGALTDAQLIERFLDRRDETAELAFRAIVERHGPMVLRVCRAVLRDADDAEDAFQATFVVLVRRAGSLWVRDSLGPWLHQVAYRTACCARLALKRRRRYEQAGAERAATAAGIRGEELEEINGVILEEVERLPARYREAVVLCLLEGVTPEQAAARLGCAVGTVHSRLARGRERLRGQLKRRGLAGPVGVLSGGWVNQGVSLALVETVVHGAMGTVGPGSSSAAVVLLTGMVMRSFMMAKLQMVVATVLVAGAVAAGTAVVARPEAAPAAADGVGAGGVVRSKPGGIDAIGDPLPDGARLRLGTLRFRPRTMVRELELSPDEKSLVTIGDDLAVWDAATGQQRWTVEGTHYSFNAPAAAYGLRGVVFSADGSKVYAMRHAKLEAWELSSGRCETVLTVQRKPDRDDFDSMVSGIFPRSIDASSDGQLLAVGSRVGVLVCDPQGRKLYEIDNTPKVRREVDNNDRLNMFGDYSLARFSPDSGTLAVLTSDRPDRIRLYESKTGKELRSLSLKARLVRFAFSPDGQQIATTERDSAIRLYDVSTGKRVWSHVVKLTDIFENYTSAIAFSPDGKTLAVGATDHRIYLLDPASGDEVGRLVGHHWYPWALAFTKDSKSLYSSGWDPTIRRWDVAARKEIGLPVGVRATGVVAASPDGRTLAYQDDSGTIRLVDAGSGTERRTLRVDGARYSQVVFSPDGLRLAGGGTNGDRVHVAVWNLADGRVVNRWEWAKGRDGHSTVKTLVFSPDSRVLAAAVFRQSAAYLWDLKAGEQVAKMDHQDVYGGSFSPDGLTLATAGWDKKIRFWDTATGAIRREFKVVDDTKGAGQRDKDADWRMYAVCYAPAAGLIATVHLSDTIRVWQAETMQLRAQFKADGLFREGSIAFSPDGLWLATGTAAGRVCLWDPLTGQKVWDRGRHQSEIYTVGFGRDGRTLVSGGEDGVCYLWDSRPTGERVGEEPNGLWRELGGAESAVAYRAMWAMADRPEQAVATIGEKLRGVKSVIDLDHVVEGNSVEETQRLRRMKRLLVDKDAKVESEITIRRAVSVLEMIGTDDAVGLLGRLAGEESARDVRRIASSALDRLKKVGPRLKP